MSRTRKDRPYWVMYNDRTLGIVEKHNHTPRRYPYRKIIEFGERKLVPYGEFKWILRHTDGTPGMTVDEDFYELRRFPYNIWKREELPMLSRSGRLRWYYEQPMRYEYVGRVESDHDNRRNGECNIDQARTRDTHWYWNCTIEPHWYKIPWKKDYGPDKDDRKFDRHKRRQHTRRTLDNMVKEYNTTGDVDDSVWLETTTRHTPFQGGWWD